MSNIVEIEGGYKFQVKQVYCHPIDKNFEANFALTPEGIYKYKSKVYLLNIRSGNFTEDETANADFKGKPYEIFEVVDLFDRDFREIVKEFGWDLSYSTSRYLVGTNCGDRHLVLYCLRDKFGDEQSFSSLLTHTEIARSIKKIFEMVQFKSLKEYSSKDDTQAEFIPKEMHDKLKKEHIELSNKYRNLETILDNIRQLTTTRKRKKRDEIAN